MKSYRTIALALLTLILTVASPVFGQSDNGTITGTVTDPTGAVVPNAKVTATNLDTGQSRETTTSDDGTYTLAELEADPYKITVEAQGFKTATIENIQVAVQVTRRADAQLEIGDISSVVTITSDTAAPVIQTDTAVRQTNVNERQVRELPLQVAAESGGRTPLAFIFLDSNVNSATGTGGSGTNASNFRVSGGQGLGTEILIDGASTRRAQNGTFFSEVAPGPNAFQEFTLSTSTYSAEFGSSSGGIVNFTLKSGGNEFHGEAYDLFRNEFFNANSYLNNATGIPRRRDHQHDFGFNAGGPIYLPRFGEGGPAFISGKNRAFFFFNYEGFRFSQTETADVSVPTFRMRQGDFGELLTDPYVLSFLGHPVQIYDPTQPPGTRAAIPGNDLRLYNGGALIDRVGLALANLYPAPTSPGVFRNYRAVSTVPTTMNNALGKLDFILSDKQRLAISYSFRKLDSIKAIEGRPRFPRFPPPYTASFDGRAPFEQFFKSHFVRLQHDYTFGPTLLNHFNAGFTRYQVANRNFSEGIAASSIGLPANATQNVALPRIGFPGYGDVGGDPRTAVDPRAYQGAGSSFFSDQLADNTVQLSDFVTWVKGRHTLKFGADFRIQQLNIHQYIDPGGAFNFRHDQTAADFDPDGGWPIASLVTGATEFSFLEIHSVDPGWRYFQPSFFVNDDFKITQRLTLNLGVRYEIPYPRTESSDRFRGFDPTVRNPAAGGRLGAIVGAGGQGGLQAEHPGLIKPDYSNIGPRVGFAYSINDKTVVRGGYGIYYSPILYGFEGGNTISEGLLGYNTFANPFTVPARRPADGPGCCRQAPFFLDTMPPAPAPDPNSQFLGQDPVDYFNKDYKTGRTAQWSLDVQRVLPANFAVSVGYIGHKATRLRSDFNRLNALPIEALRLGFPLLNKPLSAVTADERAYAQSLGFTLPASNAAVFPTFNGNVAQALKPFPQYGRVRNMLESQGQSWYHALQLKLDRRFAQGVQFGASYTFSKLITNASEDLFGGSPISGVVQNPYDRGQLRTVSPNNPYHVFVFNYIYEIPFGKGKRFFDRGGFVDKVFGGWQISGIHRYQSGLPLVVRNTEPALTDFLNTVGFNGALRPNLTGAPIFTGNAETGVRFQLVNPAAFSMPPPYQLPPTTDVTDPRYRAYYANPLRFFGDAPPVLDRARALPFFSENFSILKKTRFTETVTFEFGAEIFNLFNRHRYFGPASDLRFGDFGQSTVIDNEEIYAPRNIQMRVRLLF
jgi:hypothetical protein